MGYARGNSVHTSSVSTSLTKLGNVMQLRKPVVRAALCCLGSFVVCSCSGHRFERRVIFGGPAATRIDRVRTYSLEDQYRIFRYANDVVEPPAMDLATPIAERGAAAVPFLLEQLNSKPNDTATIRDTLLIFEEMAVSRTYDVKSDAGLMATLQARVAGMKDKGWQSTCSRMLTRIRAS